MNNKQLVKALNKNNLERFTKIFNEGQFDINFRSAKKLHRSILHQVFQGDKEIDKSEFIKLLLSRKDIDVNPVDHKGATPLHYACACDKYKCVQELLKHPKLKINSLSLAGDSPLSLAAYYDHGDIVNIMIMSGRELDIGEGGNMNDAIESADRSESYAMKSALQKFKNDPSDYRKFLRKLCKKEQLGIPELYALVFLLSDEYFEVTKKEIAEKNEEEKESERNREIKHEEHIVSVFKKHNITKIFTHDLSMEIRSVEEFKKHREEKKNKDTKQKQINFTNAKRFFEICRQLPTEMQMIISNRVFGSMRDAVGFSSFIISITEIMKRC